MISTVQLFRVQAFKPLKYQPTSVPASSLSTVAADHRRKELESAIVRGKDDSVIEKLNESDYALSKKLDKGNPISTKVDGADKKEVVVVQRNEAATQASSVQSADQYEGSSYSGSSVDKVVPDRKGKDQEGLETEKEGDKGRWEENIAPFSSRIRAGKDKHRPDLNQLPKKKVNELQVELISIRKKYKKYEIKRADLGCTFQNGKKEQGQEGSGS
ncbi:hypothetical protein BJV82DRAFT_665022 [Fennellomyces sp. T-0311]|nr:hypothetical protein BJV82DRAFT_665022 [Fennellomyces sp. T-0311]